MNNFNLNLLKYFYYVVYYNGFTNAAKNLNVVQSALSYNVKQLEIQTNKKLINRDKKVFELTEDGYNLFENIKPIFELLDHNLDQINNNNFDEITIGVRHYLSDFIFKNAINEYIERNSNIHINIKLYSKLDVKKYEDEYDIIIDYDDYTSLINSDNKIKLCKLENAFVMGKELYKNYSDINTIKELANVRFISMCPNKKNGKFQKMCFDNNILFASIVSINDSQLLKKLIKDNLGMSFVNKVFVEKEIDEDEIKVVSIKEKIFEDNIEVVYKNSKKQELIKSFINILKNQYKEGNNE